MKRTMLVVLSVLLMAAVAFGCAKGASQAANGNHYDYAAEEPAAAYEEYAFDEAFEPSPAEVETASMTNGKADGTQSTALSNRKIIRNADVSVQTLEFDAFLEKLNAQVESFGGFIETSNVGGRTYYNQSKLRNAYLVIRIPAENLDAFLGIVNGLGNVTNCSTGMRDVTTNYIDYEKHLESLRTEQEALLEILKSATTVEDLITVQNRLSEVRYEIESYESIIRSYDDQIDLSTVTLNLTEVERETVVEPETFGQEVSRRFKESMEDVGENLKSFAAGLMGNAPHIVVFLVINGLIALVIVLIIRGSIKSARKRRAKRAEQQQQK